MFLIFKKYFIWLLLVFLLTLPAVFSLLKPGYWNMHDDMQMIRQLEFEKCLKDGQIPCRWVPDLGFEYGYPLFNFYPPLPYIVGQGFRFVGYSYMWSVKLTAITQIFVASFAMFLLASSVFGPIGGLISTALYTYAPYHALNVYVRGAMNEAWAAVFFPLIFYFSRRLLLKPKLSDLILLSLSISGLMLSHNPMVLTFIPFTFVWCLFWFLSKKNNLSLLYLGLSALFGLSLSAFFTLPVLFETKYVQVESMFIGYYHYSVHFLTVAQLFFSNFWGDGPSVWGPFDGMPFMVGYLHWILPLLLLTYFLFHLIRHKKLDSLFILASILIILGIFSLFMTHNKSTFIYELLPPIQKIQFPWRFLNHAAFLFSLSVGIIPILLSKLLPSFKHKNLLVTLIIFLIIINNLNYFHPVKSGPLTDAQKFSGLAWQNQTTSGIYDYLPKTASTAPKSKPNEFVDKIIPTSATFELSGQKKGADWLFFNIKLSQPASLYLSNLAFPNFKVTDNGQPITYRIEPVLGRITLDNLSAGDHQIYVKLHNTPIRIFGNILSLVSITVLVAYLIFAIWKKLNYRV